MISASFILPYPIKNLMDIQSEEKKTEVRRKNSLQQKGCRANWSSGRKAKERTVAMLKHHYIAKHQTKMIKD